MDITVMDGHGLHMSETFKFERDADVGLLAIETQEKLRRLGLTVEESGSNEDAIVFTAGTSSKPLTFAELKIGDTFISFPSDGDDSGHGGFRKGAWLMRKTAEDDGNALNDNYVRVHDGAFSHWRGSGQVYKVLI